MKTRKTAGTSVEIALSRVCGPHDIITGFGPRDEDLRAELGGRGRQNTRKPLTRYTARNYAKLLTRRRWLHAYAHMPAKDVRRLIGRELWNDYTKFTVVRNPWDMVVSYYFFRLREVSNKPTISDWLRNSGDIERLKRDRDKFLINGQLVMDHVCRFENLSEDLTRVWKSLELPGRPELPRAKGDFRTDKRHYRDQLSDADAELIRQAFAVEIGLFGYAF
jgi:hypothetical protein